MSLMDEVKMSNLAIDSIQVQDKIMELFPEIGKIIVLWEAEHGTEASEKIFNGFVQQCINKNYVDVAIAALMLFSMSVTMLHNLLEDFNENEELQTPGQ